jgi:aminopeptidase N
LILPKAADNPSQFINGNSPYIRASMALRLLESEIGRENLLRAIGIFARENRSSTVTTKDFIDTVNQVAGRDLHWFFDQWFTRAGLPTLKATWTYDSGAKAIRVTIEQDNTDSKVREAADTSYYRGNIEIEIDGKIQTVELKPTATNTIAFPAVGPPSFVVVDPAARWIAKVEAKPEFEQLVAIAGRSSQPLARRQALTTIAQSAVAAAAPANLREQALQMMREVIDSDAYWRLKSTAIGQLKLLTPAPEQGQALPLDKLSQATLERTIRGNTRDEAWVRFNALNLLGDTRERRYEDLYISLLKDPSDRVINAAARALGKSGSAKAFDALVALELHPSWKNQSRISMLDGLGELRDPRGVDIALARLADVGGQRWTLVTPVWDYRLAAAQCLAALKASARGYEVIAPLLDKALEKKHVSDAMYNAQLLLALGDRRAFEAFDRIEAAFKGDEQVAMAIDVLRKQLSTAVRQ